MCGVHTYGGHCYFITILIVMNSQKNEAGNLLPMNVVDGLTVKILPSEQYEFLMTTKEVAHGYGVSPYSIRSTSSRNSSELIEGKHFVKGVAICNTQPHQVFWTKRGIVRLGFFIKSEQAKLFRDWAEELILNVSENLTANKQLPIKRKHNRLTSERLIRLLALTNRIEDAELRNAISSELMGKEVSNGNL